jgi:hypothetical protein
LSIDTSVSEKNTVFLFSPEEGDSTYISPKRWYLPTISKDGDCVFLKRWYLSTSPDGVATQKTDIDKDTAVFSSRDNLIATKNLEFWHWSVEKDRRSCFRTVDSFLSVISRLTVK